MEAFIFRPFPYVKTSVIFLSASFYKLRQKVIKWDKKRYKYAKDRVQSLKTLPPEMWKAHYSLSSTVFQFLQNSGQAGS
jgi:hypothetical protein